eukprot:CAMPEP_0116927248 /NCGR_PEP_ID=MMETSP0467-20121206/25230_1 /TAXON_ID=283647 /ORGANISM="Mesodinium pulex, Strain SPMC105" /LENGTH=72 /DNA_ID=CAMNT_0004606705 /DNA_START=206 /DNA_END=424 /DNA_ORIENTATION=+
MYEQLTRDLEKANQEKENREQQEKEHRALVAQKNTTTIQQHAEDKQAQKQEEIANDKEYLKQFGVWKVEQTE